MADLASLVLDKQVRIGKPVRIEGLAETTSGPAYSTSAGLIGYALKGQAATTASWGKQEEETNGLFGRFGSWFREHF